MWQTKSNGNTKWSLILFFIGKYVETIHTEKTISSIVLMCIR